MASTIVKRLIVAGIAIPTVLGGMMFPYFFCLGVSFLIFVGLQEFTAMRNEIINNLTNPSANENDSKPFPKGDGRPSTLIRCALGASLVALGFFASKGNLSAEAAGALTDIGNSMILVIVFALSMLQTASPTENAQRNANAASKGSVRAFIEMAVDVFGIYYIGGSVCTAMMLYNRSMIIFILVLACNWASDAAALFAGKQFGKHKLYPKISPNKTVEGAIAALVAPALSGFIIHSLWTMLKAADSTLHYSMMDMVVIGFVVGLAGIVGDLVESWVKRVARVKDSGNFFGAHGGVCDRIDGLFVAFPVVYCIWVYFYSV